MNDTSGTSIIHITVPRELKARWVKASQARGMKLTDWIIERLESAGEGGAASRQGAQVGTMDAVIKTHAAGGEE